MSADIQRAAEQREILNLHDLGIGFGTPSRRRDYERDVATTSRLTPQEQEIIDLHDAGLSIQQVCERVPYPRGSVLRTIRYYGNCTAEQMRAEHNAREGSRRLAAAIAATGKVFS